MSPDLFSQFDFKLLPRFSFQKDIPFRIGFANISAGWIDINIIADQQVVTYAASYVTDAIKDLLEAVVDVLPGIGDHDKYFGNLRERSRCTHDCEGDSYVFDFKRTTVSDVLLLLRNSPDLEYEEELAAFNFEAGGYWIDAEKNVLEPVVLAIRIMEVTLAYQLYQTCKTILDEIGAQEYKNRFGWDFPMELLLKIRSWLNRLPEFQHSL